MLRVDLSLRDLAPEIAVERFVGILITKKCGYRAIIYDFVAAVYQLGQDSLANPQDTASHRDFNLWANTVRAAILKHGDSDALFENGVDKFVKPLAAQMGSRSIRINRQ